MVFIRGRFFKMVQVSREFKLGSFLERKAGISSLAYFNPTSNADEKSAKLEITPDIGKKDTKEDFITECPACGCTDLIADHARAESVCKECGLVIEERIMDTTRPGWRVFDQEDAANKVSAEIVKIDGNMTTRIGSVYVDYSGKKLGPEIQNKMRRLTKTQAHNVMTRDDKHIRTAMNDMRVIAGNLGLSNKIRDEAVIAFKKSIKGRNLCGKPVYNLMMSILLKTCKDNKIPFKITEFSKQANMNRKRLSSTYMDVVQESDNHDLSSPLDFLPRFSSTLQLDDTATITAHKFLTRVVNDVTYSNISIGKEAAGYAAAAVYLSSLEHNLQPIREMRLVAIVTGVAESTLKKRVEEMIKVLGLDANKYRENKYDNFCKSERVRYRLKPDTIS